MPRSFVRALLVFAVLALASCARIARPPAPGAPTPPSTSYEVVQGRTADVVAHLRAAPPLADPEVSDGRSMQADTNRLLAQGLVQIGIGHFAERDMERAREQAQRKGRDVGADKVLIYLPAGDGSSSMLTASYYVRLHLPFGASFRELTSEERQSLGSSGVEITDVVGGTPAAQANLREGDVVLKFNHTPVQDKAGFQTALEQNMGKRAVLTIRREDATFERIVRIGILAAPVKH